MSVDNLPVPHQILLSTAQPANPEVLIGRLRRYTYKSQNGRNNCRWQRRILDAGHPPEDRSPGSVPSRAEWEAGGLSSTRILVVRSSLHCTDTCAGSASATRDRKSTALPRRGSLAKERPQQTIQLVTGRRSCSPGLASTCGICGVRNHCWIEQRGCWRGLLQERPMSLSPNARGRES